MTGKLPPSASVAIPASGAMLHAPAADRNKDALCDLLREHAPQKGRALEIASGTGQHIAAFARALPDLHWQPTEPAPDRRASIDAYITKAALPNVAPAAPLDATATSWNETLPAQDLIFFANLLHLIPTDAAQRVITEAALDKVVAITAINGVVALTTVDCVFAGTAHDAVVVIASEDVVVSITAINNVIALRAENIVVALAT